MCAALKLLTNLRVLLGQSGCCTRTGPEGSAEPPPPSPPPRGRLHLPRPGAWEGARRDPDPLPPLLIRDRPLWPRPPPRCQPWEQPSHLQAVVIFFLSTSTLEIFVIAE